MTLPDGTAILPATWQVLRHGPATGDWNMAVDAALLAHARAAPSRMSRYGVWRTYGWSTPTVSFGRHERTRGRFDEASIARAGFGAVRRPTGGRALMHAREVTYSATFPLPSSASWQAAYAAVNAVLVTGLAMLGVEATIVHGASATSVRPDGPLCFDAPAPGEIVVGAAKLVGSAVWRDRHAYLQHGSILVHDDQHLLHDAACIPLPALPPAATLASCCVHVPSSSLVADALETALGQQFRVQRFVEPAGFDADIATRRAQMTRADWLWRR